MAKVFLLGLMLVLIVFTTISSNVSAQDLTEDDKKAYFAIIEKYNLKIVDEIPTGIEPKAISSPEELEKFAQYIQSLDHKTTVSTVSEVDTNDINNPNGTNYNTFVRTCSISVGNASVNVTSRIRVGAYNSSYRWIDSATTTVTLSGVTVGLDLVNTWFNNWITPNKTSIDVEGGGNVNYYTWTAVGRVVVETRPVQCSFYYSIY